MIKALVLSLFLAALVPFKSDAPEKCEANPQPDCFCTLQYDPVCGCNGVTYGNACQAACDGITKVKPGECKGKKND